MTFLLDLDHPISEEGEVFSLVLLPRGRGQQ